MAVAAIEQPLKMPPEVALDLKLDGMGNRKTALVKKRVALHWTGSLICQDSISGL